MSSKGSWILPWVGKEWAKDVHSSMMLQALRSTPRGNSVLNSPKVIPCEILEWPGCCICGRGACEASFQPTQKSPRCFACLLWVFSPAEASAVPEKAGAPVPFERP